MGRLAEGFTYGIRHPADILAFLYWTKIRVPCLRTIKAHNTDKVEGWDFSPLQGAVVQSAIEESSTPNAFNFVVSPVVRQALGHGT